MKSAALLILLLNILLIISCNSQTTQGTTPNAETPKFEKLKGLSMVARPDSFTYNPMEEVKAVNADWVAVIPYGFIRQNEAAVQYNEKWQWWGERPIGIRTTIQKAKEQGIKVMLKPQIWMMHGWVGHMDFKTQSDWQIWEKTYETFIMQMVDIANEEKVELFCIGTEFEIAAVKRPQYWKNLIQKVRTKYDGKITYAANWDKFETITFWEDLDYIGIDAYFPLVNEKTPKIDALKAAWEVPLSKIEKLYKATNVPIIFTEFGYMSVDRTAYNTWELEEKEQSIAVNEAGQVNALEALFETFWEKNWWAGGFIWKWYPDIKGNEKSYAKDYTPQGKQAEDCLKKWYAK
jgi:hypothetical protein